jgi:hypothetical protein
LTAAASMEGRARSVLISLWISYAFMTLISNDYKLQAFK